MGNNDLRKATEENLAVQIQRNKLQKRYKAITLSLVGVLVIAVVLLFTQLNFGPPKQVEWSEWVDVLPEYVTNNNYDIEEQKLYRSRDMQVKISSENNPDAGWALIKTEQINPVYTEWSDWSADRPDAAPNRETEASVRNRSREKEWCTVTGGEPDGNDWVLESSSTEWSDWSDWGDWTTDVLVESDSRDVETKKMHIYDVSRYTCNCNSSFEKISIGMVSHAYSLHGITEEVEADLYNLFRGDYTGPLDQYDIVLNAGFWLEDQFMHLEEDDPVNITSSGAYEIVDEFGSRWYAFTDGPMGIYDMYRCRTKSLVESNLYYRWGDWSDWSDSAVSESNDVEVESETFYRYRDYECETEYYFGCWNAWSEYTAEVKVPDDTRQVDTKIQYRYKSK